MRLVLDTNTVVSGFLWHNAPRRLIEAAIARRIELFTTEHLIAELEDVLTRSKFAPKIAEEGVSAEGLVDRYTRLAEIVIPVEISPAVRGDPDDDAVLACALAGAADLIVSRDKRIRNLKHFHRIPIVTPAEALARIRNASARS